MYTSREVIMVISIIKDRKNMIQPIIYHLRSRYRKVVHA